MTHEQKLRVIADNLVRELSDRGQIIEGGWRAYELLALKDASEVQKSECRKAFFLGADHLFTSMLMFLQGGTDATDLDVERMNKIHAEVTRFREGLKK